MAQLNKCVWLMWLCLILCLLAPLNNFQYADAMEELATSVILLAIAILTDKIIAYILLSLAVGKLIDGQQNPYAYGVGELIWDIVTFVGAIILYFYRKKRSKSSSL